MIVKQSTRDYAETLNRLIAAIERRGLTVFARIDHAAGARAAAMELADEEVVLLGNPRSGTPLMQADPTVGIELPLRVLVWRGPDAVLLGYRDPRELDGTYELAANREILEQMAALLDSLLSEAAG